MKYDDMKRAEAAWSEVETARYRASEFKQLTINGIPNRSDSNRSQIEFVSYILSMPDEFKKNVVKKIQNQLDCNIVGTEQAFEEL